MKSLATNANEPKASQNVDNTSMDESVDFIKNCDERNIERNIWVSIGGQMLTSAFSM